MSPDTKKKRHLRLLGTQESQSPASSAITVRLGIEPLNGIISGEDSPIGPVAVRRLLFLGVDAVQRGCLATATGKGSEVNVGRSRVGQLGDTDLAEQVDAIGRDGDTDELEVFRAERGELGVAEVFLGRISESSAGSM